MPNAPVLYSPDVETIQPDELGVVAGLNATFDTILEKTAADYGYAVRGVHAKAHAILEGVFTVDDGLPPALAQGVFARPGAHRAYLRFSSNPGDILPDSIGLPRGLGLKILDVPGERMDGAAGTSQDFVMVNAPVFIAKTAKQFAGNLKLLAGTTDRYLGAKKALSAVFGGANRVLSGIGVTVPVLNALGGAPNTDPLGETYYSATPFRYGEHIAKFSLAPVSESLRALHGKRIATRARPDAIRETLREELRVLDAVWEFRVQLCRDLRRQPVEDPTVRWDESLSPFERVAMLRVAAQDSWDEARVRLVNETMRFSVWTGLTAHRPLGNVNRARREIYQHSASFRAARNGCPIHEPDGAVS